MESLKAMDVHDRLKYIRESRGLTLAEVAAGIGVTAQAVHRYENTDVLPSLDVMRRIAIFYKMDPKKLFF